MGQVRENGKTTFQARFETCLFLGLLIFVEVALQFAVYRNFISIRPYYIGISLLKRLMLLLAVAAAAELAFLCVKRPEQGREKLRELRGMLGFEQLFLLFVAVWFLLTCVLRGHAVGGDYLEANNLELFMAFSVAFLLFPFASLCGRKRARASMEGLMATLVLPYAMFTAWVLWHYYRAEYVTLPSGAKLEMGAEAMLQFQGQNHNILAQTGLVMLGLSVVLVHLRRSSVEKYLYALCGLVFAIFLVLTNSRNAWFGAFLFLAGTAFLFGWRRFEEKGPLVRLVFGVAFAVLAGVIWYWMKGAVFALLRASLARFAVVGAASAGGMASAAGAVEARGYGDLAAAGNRMPLYKAALAAMFSSPRNFFFGVTPADVVGTLRDTGVPGVSGTYNYGQAHNFFLQMGVSFGVPVMLGTLAFCIRLAIRGLRLMFGGKRFPAWAGIVALLAGCILSCDMLEAALAFRARFICLAFYLLAGWLVMMERDGQRE